MKNCTVFKQWTDFHPTRFQCAALTFMQTQWAIWKLKHSCNLNTRCAPCVYSHAWWNSFTKLSCPWKKEAVHGVFCCDRNKQAALVWVRAGFSKMGRMWCFRFAKKQLSELLRFSAESSELLRDRRLSRSLPAVMAPSVRHAVLSQWQLLRWIL